jgi:hypothetical protein
MNKDNIIAKPQTNKKILDFIVIGAAKSGTTTLFELTKNHPDISMPSAKEVPFFSEENIYQKGINWYLQEYFHDKSSSSLWGTVTPQYMLGENDINPELISERIKKDLPGVKLVTLLRHPIKRAFSHYKMLYQRGHLTKSFEEYVDGFMTTEDYENFRSKNIRPDNAFFFGSEYGRILKSYYDKFSSQQILILFTEDLKSKPEEVLVKYLNFLEVDETYRPEKLSLQSRKGGEKAKVRLLTPDYIFKIPFVKKAWKNYTPYTFRKKVEYSINLWNIKPDDTTLDPKSPTYKKLVEYFAPDIKKLEEITGQKTPWQDWS